MTLKARYFPTSLIENPATQKTKYSNLEPGGIYDVEKIEAKENGLFIWIGARPYESKYFEFYDNGAFVDMETSEQYNPLLKKA